MSIKIQNEIILALFQEKQILGCYNSTPLKMNLVLEIWKMVVKEIGILYLWIFFTFLSSSVFLVKIPPYFAYDNLIPSNLLY